MSCPVNTKRRAAAAEPPHQEDGKQVALWMMTVEVELQVKTQTMIVVAQCHAIRAL